MWIDGPDGPGTGLRADGADGGDANPLDYSKTSDDEILSGGADDGADEEEDDDPAAGLEADGDEAEESGDGEEEGEGQDEEDPEAVAAAAAAAGKDGKDKGIVDKPTTAVVEPELLKPVFKAHPELRTAWYAEKAFREVMPTVAEARQYREIAPTLDNLKHMQSMSGQLEAFDDLYFSDNPADHETFIQGLHTEDPAAFARFAGAFPQALFKLAPDLYRQDTAARIRATFDNLERLAGADAAGVNMKNAIAVLRNRLKLTTAAAGEAVDPREAEIARREKAVTEKENQRETQKFQDFHVAANDHAVTQVVDLIKAELKTALDNTPITEKARNRMVGDIYNEIDATLKAQRDLRQTLRRAFRDGKLDDAHRDKVASLVVGRAKQLIKNASTKVINEWTNDILATNSRKIADKRKAAGRPDVTGAAGAGAGNRAQGKPVKATDIDYRKTSDDDILAGRATGKAARK